uniref:Uncharacterized protein n=1 Tax=Pristionchus pacificus TaxID=54126 RepID=A0A2A6CYK0_PRIPA|eukprot:PDM83101.1 hypothetical protein PRIPAC_37494 [Pristionchus pacificus]
MLLPILLLVPYVHFFASGHIVSNPSLHYSDALKLKCDALPFRSVYFDRNCYFAIDAEGDSAARGSACSAVLMGAQLAAKTPEAIWRLLWVDKSNFVNGGDASGNRKAMCFYENAFAHSTDMPNVALKDYYTANKTTDQRLTAVIVMQINSIINNNVKFPKLPALWGFNQKLEIGQTITIKGTFDFALDGAAINLQTKNQQQIALHMKPMFSKNHIVLNSAVVYGKWGYEEILPTPIKKGKAFEVSIRITADQFQISVDGMALYNYKQRLPLAAVTHLWVWGSGSLSSVQLGEMYNPAPYSIGATAIEDKSSKTSSEVHNLTAHWNMPYLAPFTDKIEPGKTVIIKGGTFADVEGIAINLQTKNQESIALHFKIMFNKGQVVMNSAPQYDKWGKEEIRSNLLVKGSEFDIRIRFQDTFFQITVNGVAFYNYNYRLPLSSFTHLWVWGQGYLTMAQIGEKFNHIKSSFANGFPVCGQDSCSAQREMYATRVQITECKSLYVSGYFGVPSLYDFYVDIKRKNGEIALRIVPRFNFNNVGLNTFKGGKWLKEETIAKSPFKRDNKFIISITNEVFGFQIFVNGVFFATYEHRTCPFDIYQVEVGPFVYDIGIQI